ITFHLLMSKVRQKMIQYLSYILFLGYATGFIFISRGDEMGRFIVGVSVLLMVFILMPIFLYHRWNGKKLKDYTLTKENFQKMRQYSKENKF
ncbi:MAG: hypothetical protein OXC67_01965, partial [Flavobacteriaceae bacterium]|nr:hypothetical protein [Flavobacteriaceae bacterium]